MLNRIHWTLDPSPRQGAMRGSMKAEQVREGVPRGRFGLRQRRVRARLFGEPQFEAELVPEDVCAPRPHVLAWLAWSAMSEAAVADGISTDRVAIYSAYRSVELQTQVWEYRLQERRDRRAAAGRRAAASCCLPRSAQVVILEP